MSKYITLVILSTVLSLGADLSGKWTGKLMAPKNGSAPIYFMLQQHAGKLAGYGSDASGVKLALLPGATFNRGVLIFRIQVDDDRTATFKLTLRDSNLQGEEIVVTKAAPSIVKHARVILSREK